MTSRRTLISLFILGAVSGQKAAERETALFTLRCRFWPNLHHFLYVLGRAQNNEPDSKRAAVASAVNDRDGVDAISTQEQTVWQRTMALYQSSLSKKDLVFDRDLGSITATLCGTPDNDEPPATLDERLRKALLAAASVYRRVWWPRHANSNRVRIAELQGLLDHYGRRIAKSLTDVYHEPWPKKGFTVDVTAYANWAGAYSTAAGVIVLASSDQATSSTQGLETIFHEATHQWDDSVAARLNAVARRIGARVPRQLSHSLIFYTAGYAVSHAVTGHRPYAEINGLWDRGSLLPKDKLDDLWRPYLQGEGTFDTAIEALLKALAA